jgi:hypothetical protein
MGTMGLQSDTCDYPGCGTKLKPLFSSLYCPLEESHGKLGALQKVIAEAQDLMAKPRIWGPYPSLGIPAVIPHTAAPPCPHHSTVTMNGVTKCLQCGEELTTPYP